nr:fibrillin-3-like [Pocillopora verrucosa]
MAWRQFKAHITVLVMASVALRHLTSQQCGTDLHSVYQMMLQGHTFKTLKTQPGTTECRQACRADIRCQSFNVVFKGICELNNRTKEARPDDFVKDLERYYVKSSTRVPLGSVPGLPADSCKEIKASEGGQAVSGNYWLDSPRTGNSILARCDMKTEVADYCIKHKCQNSAACVNRHVNYTCACTSSGWTLPYCEKDIDECTEGSHGCHRDATCQNTAGSYRCTCNSQYIGDGLNCEPKECSNYKTLTSARRLKGSTSTKPHVCDNSLTWGWYRITGAAGRKMPTACVPFKRCGGQRPGWLSGGHPNKADGRVSRKVWFRSSDNCYRVSTTITVRNCGSFYVYYLKGFSHGSNCHRYCSSY